MTPTTWSYFGTTLLAAGLVRVLMSLIRTVEFRCPAPRPPSCHPWAVRQHEPRRSERSFWRDLLSDAKGFHDDKDRRDWLQPFILGYLELLAYPLLFVPHLAAIGAWLTIKTAAQWQAWHESRAQFNRFLIGNALAIAAAFAIYLLGLAPSVPSLN